MSSTDDEDAAGGPRPLQIVRTGDTNDFELCAENLEEIVAKIPAGMKVSVVSVVGAFRTGKSFLLSFFLRYLRHGDAADMGEEWMTRDGASLSEGNMNEGSATSAAAPGSFAWRGGAERQTTGIWMWSEPFIRSTAHSTCSTSSSAPEDIAVLLVDTQGMFDNDTTMTVTSQVFGLSALISSCQIYNVDKRIQEDNLQHLALFAEYGRMALDKSGGAEDEADVELPKPPPSAGMGMVMPPAPPTAAGDSAAAAPKEEADQTAAAAATQKNEANDKQKENPSESLSSTSSLSVESLKGDDSGFVSIKTGKETQCVAPASSASASTTEPCKPFQHLQFLVRDWQNWPDDVDGWDGADADEEDVAPAVDDHKAAMLAKLERQGDIYRKLRYGMDSYVGNVLKDRAMGDLQATREQISRCFDTLDCFWLPHPGAAVTRLNYNGSVKKIESLFRGLLNRFVRHVFDLHLQPKLINGRALTGRALQQFIDVYCTMFQAGGGAFPKAMTMLEATSEANNRVAFDAGKSCYTAGMERVAGVGCDFIKESKLLKHHARLYAEALERFNEIATMGATSSITLHRTKLIDDMGNLKSHYVDTNALRNPYKDMELYVVPCVVASVSWLLSKIVGGVCGGDVMVCAATERMFVRVFYIVLLVLLFVMWKQISGAFNYTAQLLLPIIKQALADNNVGGAGASASSVKSSGKKLPPVAAEASASASASTKFT